MRIALVISSLQAGGAERVMATLANAFVSEHEVHLVRLSPLPDHYELDGRVSTTAVAHQSRWRLMRISVDKVRQLVGLRRELKSFQPDVVVSFLDFTNARTLLATRRTGIPIVISERVDPRAHRIVRTHRFLRWLTYRWTDRLVVQTDSVAAWASRVVRPERVRVLPNPLAFRLGAGQIEGPREHVVLGVGRLQHQKGFDLLIEAFASVASEFPSWKLRILGEGPDREKLEAMVVAHGLVGRVEMPGVSDAIATEMRGAAVFVLPSRYEGFPNALLEALAAATASIATDCPSGPDEIVHDGVTGMLVPVEDPDALADALRRLCDDPIERRRLGRAGWEASARFDQQAVAAGWLRMLTEVVHERVNADPDRGTLS